MIDNVLLPFSVTLYAEFLPAHQRGKCVVLLDVSWLFLISIERKQTWLASSVLLHLYVFCLPVSFSQCNKVKDQFPRFTETKVLSVTKTKNTVFIFSVSGQWGPVLKWSWRCGLCLTWVGKVYWHSPSSHLFSLSLFVRWAPSLPDYLLYDSFLSV